MRREGKPHLAEQSREERLCGERLQGKPNVLAALSSFTGYVDSARPRVALHRAVLLLQ